MKIAVYEMRPDESARLKELKEQYKLELVTTGKPLSADTLELAKGCQGISILGYSSLNRTVLTDLKTCGVRYISTRTIGYNHIDLSYAKEIGMRVCNSTYPPDGVAEFTVMLMLLALRHYKPAIWRQNVNDYSLKGLIGKELGGQTVGIIGTGKIGSAVIKILSGFGCRLLAYNRQEKEEIKKYASYVSLTELYREADIISLHVPLSQQNHHLINSQAINQMK